MTDITELAQSLKAAAIDAKELAIIARYSKGRAAAEKFYALANPNNVIALVEALENAQQERDNWRTSFDNERFRADKLKAHIDEMTEERTASINELSRIIQKEVKAKREAEKRISELEREQVAYESVAMALRDDMRVSRTVTVKKFDEFQICHYGTTEDYAKGYIDCQNNFFKWLNTAGIKWEAE
ncbi:hypothetical protein [Pluralibacter gergoviae]|uniref:hypothetical protein n=1 Tax=Pluralibacter gergoviae TaxID=61647 RepID=UPI002906FF14|nr:hypothetical protein [Pluralibacter gergoviae]MDU4001417.1 hypothetical protein [Pluralibacter gergoviae]